MPRPTLTILHDDTSRGSTVRDPLPLLSEWAVRDNIQIDWLALHEVREDPEAMPSTGAVWLLLAEHAVSEVDDVMELFAERHLPVLLTAKHGTPARGEMYDEGIVACPPDEPDAVCCAMVQALVSQSLSLRSLTLESKLLRLETDNVSEQIGRIDDELRLASQLQKEFLRTSLPSFPRVDFATLWRPASYVSGDMFDIQRLDEDHVGIFLADAVGHGVPAALMTMFLKRSLTTKVIDPREQRGYRLLEPAEAMARVNRDMVSCQAGSETMRFATACYGVLNIHTLELRLARAGHPFPLVLKPDGKMSRIDPDGGLLAVFPEETFEQQRVFLETGDRLLMYTDGFELAFTDEIPTCDRYGRKRVSSTAYLHEFENLRFASIERAVEQLAGRLDNAAGSLNQRDDLTLIAVHIK